MLDRVMQMLDVPRIPSTDLKADTGYYIKEVDGEFSKHAVPLLWLNF